MLHTYTHTYMFYWFVFMTIKKQFLFNEKAYSKVKFFSVRESGELCPAGNCAQRVIVRIMHGFGTFLDRETLRRGEMFMLEKGLQDITIDCIGGKRSS